MSMRKFGTKLIAFGCFCTFVLIPVGVIILQLEEIIDKL